MQSVPDKPWGAIVKILPPSTSIDRSSSTVVIALDWPSTLLAGPRARQSTCGDPGLCLAGFGDALKMSTALAAPLAHGLFVLR